MLTVQRRVRRPAFGRAIAPFESGLIQVRDVSVSMCAKCIERGSRCFLLPTGDGAFSGSLLPW